MHTHRRQNHPSIHPGGACTRLSLSGFKLSFDTAYRQTKYHVAYLCVCLCACAQIKLQHQTHTYTYASHAHTLGGGGARFAHKHLLCMHACVRARPVRLLRPRTHAPTPAGPFHTHTHTPSASCTSPTTYVSSVIDKHAGRHDCTPSFRMPRDASPEIMHNYSSFNPPAHTVDVVTTATNCRRCRRLAAGYDAYDECACV